MKRPVNKKSAACIAIATSAALGFRKRNSNDF